MWMKSVPHCTFSDFQGRNGESTFKHPSTIKKGFTDIPNYRLTGKSFDAMHLDRFIVRVNESDRDGFAGESVHNNTAEKQKSASALPDDAAAQ